MLTREVDTIINQIQKKKKRVKRTFKWKRLRYLRTMPSSFHDIFIKNIKSYLECRDLKIIINLNFS